MNFCLRSFTIAIVLLHFCRLSAEDGQWLNFNSQANPVCIAWADSAGEEDSKEFEDDDMAGHVVLVLVGEPSSSPIADLGFPRFDDHVGEMILPPPLA